MELLPIWDKSQVAPALEMYLLPESAADFVFQNQTYGFMKPKLRNIREATAVIDTRHLDSRSANGYIGDFSLYAEYNYDPHNDNSNVTVLGHRPYAYDSNLQLSYFLRLGLDNALNLNRREPIESNLVVRNKHIEQIPRKSIKGLHLSTDQYIDADLTFRTSSKEDVKACRNYGESDPKVFVAVLYEALNGFQQFIKARDNPID